MAYMSDTVWQESEIFDCGPPLRLQRSIGLVKPHELRSVRRAVFAVLIGWLPLPILAGAQSVALSQNVLTSLLSDFAVHARYLIAVPLFILAEPVILPGLGNMVRQFIESGLIDDSDRGRFEVIVADTRRLLDSRTAEIIVFLLAYIIVGALIGFLPAGEIPAWHKIGSNGHTFSWAGWWHAFASIPLLVVLLLGWLWRIFLWGLLLRRVSGLDLRLIAAHPDLAGGLQFLGTSLRVFPIIGFALATIVAGGIANHVVHLGTSLLSYKYLIATLAILVLILFAAPLLVFSKKLVQAKRRGIFEYGTLAAGMGLQFEHKWLGSGRKPDPGSLEVPDFSATTDLYQIAGNVYQVKFLPLGLRDVTMLIVMTLLPFLPVLLYEVPTNVILKDLVKVLL